MRKLFYSLAIFAASFSLFSCNSSKTEKKSETATATTTQSCCDDKTKCDDKDIKGSWTLTSINSDQVAESDSVYLNFEKDDKLNGMTGCNRIFGEYKTEDKNISFDKLGSTRMACPNDMLETKVLTGIAEIKSFSIDTCNEKKEQILTFFNKDNKAIMTFKKK